MVLSHMTMLDNIKGMGAFLASGSGSEYDERVVELNDNLILGETEISDCPEKERPPMVPDFCFQTPKFGLTPAVVLRGGKPLHPTMPSQMPLDRIKTEPAWAGRAVFSRNTFKDFSAFTRLSYPDLQGTKCWIPSNVFGRCNNSAIGYAATAADYQPLAELHDTTFDNVELAAAAQLMSPP